MTTQGKDMQMHPETKEYLTDVFTQADVIYINIPRVARSGMARDISLFVVTPEYRIQRVTALAHELCGYRYSTKNGRRNEGAIHVRGCGMDMGWAVVHEMCASLGIETKRTEYL